jgi:iron only hydrogenase large subunit-like protein
LYRSETDEEETENGTPDSGNSLPLSQHDDSPYPEEEESRPGTAFGGDTPASVNKQVAGAKMLTPEETIELARNAVESGIQDTKRSLAGSEAVTDVVKPKLTIDLGHSNIVRIPEPVVDLIKDEVER